MPLDWWAKNIPPLLDDTGAVRTCHLTTGGVTSERLSANALRRSVVIPIPDLGAATTTPLTSANVVWTPSVPVVVEAAYVTPLTSWVQTSVQSTVVGTLYAGSAVLGTVVFPTTNAPVGGVPLTVTLTTDVNVPAGTALAFALPAASSNGMNAPPHSLQIEYSTTA